MSPGLSLNHGLCFIVGSALVSNIQHRNHLGSSRICRCLTLLFIQGAHALFKRYEPRRARVHALLLVVVPLVFSSLLICRLSIVAATSVTFALYWGTLVLSIALYRLSPYHPLSRYPGPVILRLSKWSMAWVSRGGKRHLYTQELHRRYGDVIRIGA